MLGWIAWRMSLEELVAKMVEIPSQDWDFGVPIAPLALNFLLWFLKLKYYHIKSSDPHNQQGFFGNEKLYYIMFKIQLKNVCRSRCRCIAVAWISFFYRLRTEFLKFYISLFLNLEKIYIVWEMTTKIFNLSLQANFFLMLSTVRKG